MEALPPPVRVLTVSSDKTFCPSRNLELYTRRCVFEFLFFCLDSMLMFDFVRLFMFLIHSQVDLDRYLVARISYVILP